uniref:Ion transport domain-containing protein n=1 Tax=Plectus sambesii TaxID=2011161 RepID=A0A914W3X7_9BILA
QWQWELGSVCVFLAWINLVLMIRKFPRFGIYVVMFTDILKTFSRFFLVFVLFVTAFAMGFFVLFQNRPSFSNVRISMMKTSVMMVGELDFDGLFSNPSTEHSETTFNRPFAYALFMFFLIVMTILLMNLLIGLAVDDIKAVQEKAVLKRLAMQVELVLHVERALPDKARRRYMLGRQKLFPNQRSVLKNIRRFFMGDDDTAQLNVNTISNHLNQELSEMAQVKLNQERFGKELDDVGSRLNGIGVQQRRLHSMMTAVMGHLKVNWEDQDEFQ